MSLRFYNENNSGLEMTFNKMFLFSGRTTRGGGWTIKKYSFFVKGTNLWGLGGRGWIIWTYFVFGPLNNHILWVIPIAKSAKIIFFSKTYMYNYPSPPPVLKYLTFLVCTGKRNTEGKRYNSPGEWPCWKRGDIWQTPWGWGISRMGVGGDFRREIYLMELKYFKFNCQISLEFLIKHLLMNINIWTDSSLIIMCTMNV